MKMKKIVSAFLALLMLMSTMSLSTSAEDSAIASINGVPYTSLDEALKSAKKGDVIELSSGTYELGAVSLPTELVQVTLKGAPDKTTVVKNSKITSAKDAKLNYTDIVIDGIVFDNSYISLTGKGTGEAVYKNWTVTNCEFKNIVTPDKNQPAFVYSQKAVEEGICLKNKFQPKIMYFLFIVTGCLVLFYLKAVCAKCDSLI